MNKITQSAKGEDCTIRLPGICNGNPETVVFCHISGIRHGHGVGQKTDFGAYGCSDCHDAVDGRRKTDFTRDSVRLAHFEGAIETMRKLDEKGLIQL